MRRFLLIAGLLLCALTARANPTCAWGQNGTSTTSGCPPNFNFATQGSTTPVLATNTANYTNPVTGVLTAGIYCIQGIPYSSTVGYVAASGNVQSSQDITACAPKECWSQESGTPSLCAPLYCYPDGAFYQHGVNASPNGGCYGDLTIAQEAILIAEELNGKPTPVGNHTAVYMVNYRKTAAPVGFGTSDFQAQWQDAKCPIWYVIANPTVFPSNVTYALFWSQSAGASLVIWATESPDTAYTMSGCLASAPATDPVYRAVAGWTPWTFLYPVGNSYTLQSGAYQNAMIGLFGWTTNTLAQMETNCATFSETCDIGNAIASGAWNTSLQNTALMTVNGFTDCTVYALWNSTSNSCSGLSGTATGGNYFEVGTSFSASGSGVHPFPQYRLAGHESTTGTIDGGMWLDSLNFLYTTNQTGSAGLGGSFGL